MQTVKGLKQLISTSRSSAAAPLPLSTRTSRWSAGFLPSGYRNHDKKKCHKYDKSRTRKKAGGRDKEAAGGARRGGGGRGNGQRPSCSHSDDEEDEGVPASYHTVSLQVSQDVSTTTILPILPARTRVSSQCCSGIQNLSQ